MLKTRPYKSDWAPQKTLMLTIIIISLMVFSGSSALFREQGATRQHHFSAKATRAGEGAPLDVRSDMSEYLPGDPVSLMAQYKGGDTTITFEVLKPDQSHLTIFSNNTIKGNIPVNTEEMVGEWGLDEGAGQSAGDTSGNANHGQLGITDTPDQSDPQWAEGLSGNCLEFDGVDDHVLIDDDDSLDLSTEVTLETWVKLKEKDRRQCFIGKRHGTAATQIGYLLKMGDNNDMSLQFNGFGHSAGNLTTGVWYHLAGTYDGETIKLYINGSLISSLAHTGSITVNNAPLYLGAFHYSSLTNELNGYLDSPRVYNRVLDEQEIFEHWANVMSVRSYFNFTLPDDSIPGNYSVWVSNALDDSTATTYFDVMAPEPTDIWISRFEIPLPASPGDNILIEVEIQNSHVYQVEGLLALQMFCTENSPTPPELLTLTFEATDTREVEFNFVVPLEWGGGPCLVQVMLLTGLPSEGGHLLDHRNGELEIELPV